MNRRKVPPEMASVVHSGWMTKSPPERQLRMHFKIFHSHWKKRYFVLRKPTGSLPDQYELHYYKDQRCTNKKGSIDLDQCEQIIEALDSDVFPFLLAIKTSYKHKIRTYYLATDTEQDMNTWVKWLCHVCGLRPEDQPTDIPDLKPDQTAGAGAQRSGSTVVNGTTSSPHQQVKLSDSPMSTNPRVSAGHLARTHSRASTSSETSLGHFSPVNRLTGLQQSLGRKTSVESTSESVAPPLPEKRHLLHNNGMASVDDDVFISSVYDHPPTRRSVDHSSVRGIVEHTSKQKESSSLYKVPPYLSTRDNKLSVGETSLADESTSLGRSPLTSLSSSLDSWTSCGISSQAVTSAEGYDHPFSNHSLSVSTDNETPPERPPKPSHLQSPYQNLPPTGKTAQFTDLNTVLAHPKSNQPKSGPGYDIPRSSQRSMQHHQTELSHVPAAPQRSGSHSSGSYSSHIYLNTMNNSGSGEHPGGSQGGSDEDYSLHSETGLTVPAVPPPRAGHPGESPAGNSGSHSLYQCPPSPSSASAFASGNASRTGLRLLSQGPAISSRIPNGHSAGQNQEEASPAIFSTKRTRSFKSPYSLKNSVARHSPKANSVSLSSTIPAPRPLLPPRPKEMSTSEDDEEMRAHEPEEETHHPLSLLRSIPAPSSQTEKELKYIDLAPPEANPDPPRFSHAHSHSHSRTDHSKEQPTEYREIDFVKTQALNDTKRVKDKERNNDDQS